MIHDIRDFQNPEQVARLLRRISNQDPLDDMQLQPKARINNDSEESALDVDNHPSKQEVMERCVRFLMSCRRSFSVDMDISARKICSGDICSILKLIWLTIVRFRLEVIAEIQLLKIQSEVDSHYFPILNI